MKFIFLILDYGPSVATSSELLRPESSLALDSSFLALLEREARGIAASVDGLTEHLAVSLHTVRYYSFTFYITYREIIPFQSRYQQSQPNPWVSIKTLSVKLVMPWMPISKYFHTLQ